MNTGFRRVVFEVLPVGFGRYVLSYKYIRRLQDTSYEGITLFPYIDKNQKK